MTSQTLLETLKNNIEIVSATLSANETDQFVAFLSKVAETEEDNAVEDAVDDLFDFCLKFTPLKEMLAEADRAEGHVGSPGQKLNPKPLLEQEKQVRPIANRLIKAVQESREKYKKSGIKK